MTYPEKMTVTEFLNEFRHAHTDLSALWEDLSEEQMTRRPGPQDDWSVKDLIAHLTWWEMASVERSKMLLDGGDPPDYSEFNDLNQEIYEANKDDALDDVLENFAGAHNTVEEFLDNITDEVFNQPRDPHPTIYKRLAGNTYGHYDMHRDDLVTYIESLK